MTGTLLRTRGAIFGVFGLNGLTLAIWAVYIPAILEKTHTPQPVLGVLLLILGIGAFAGMQIGGHLADRLGSKYTTILFALWSSLAFVLIGFSNMTWFLGLSMVLFGFGNGGLDVSMNLQAANLEENYKRAIMSAFHALFSVGTFAGAIIGASAQALKIDSSLTFLFVGITGFIIVFVLRPFLLITDNRHQDVKEDSHVSKNILWRVVLLGSIAFLLMLSEGVANDWSALQIKEQLHVTGAEAALGYAAFAVFMTVGRFGADRISTKFGPIAVVRYGSLIAASGMLIVILSHTLLLTLIGWGLFGLGISGAAPQLFTASGKISKAKQGLIMSRVVGAGYIGLLAGPAIIGVLINYIPLSLAMILPLAFVIVSAIAAKKVMQ